jgi:hypothetical protein
VKCACDLPNVSKARAPIWTDLKDMRQKKVSARELYRARRMQRRDIPHGDAGRNSIAPAWLARSAPGLSLDEPVRAGKTCPQAGSEGCKEHLCEMASS